METNSLFPLKYRLRKTDEQVEIVAWDTLVKGARSERDWVSYIDSAGVEHIKEHLTLEWDFVIDSPFESMMKKFEPTKLPEFDPWEGRRFELVKELVIENGEDLDIAIEIADEVIAALKKSPEAKEFVEDAQKDDGYENIGVGKIVEEEIGGLGLLKKFVFTDKKDIVGFRGDSGRWTIGDKVKVYIKKYEPKKGLD